MDSPSPRHGRFTQLLVDLAADLELLERWLRSEDEREAIMDERGLSEEQKELIRRGDLHDIHAEVDREQKEAEEYPDAPTYVAMVVMWRVMW